MSFYWFNRQELLQKAKGNITIKKVNKKLLSIMVLSIMLLTLKF